jgi:hypothetical protein
VISFAGSDGAVLLVSLRTDIINIEQDLRADADPSVFAFFLAFGAFFGVAVIKTVRLNLVR